MSLLDEVLERQLRKITAPSKPKASTPALRPTPKITLNQRSIHLVYQEGTSDKEYLVQLVDVGGGDYEVHFQFGRRGKTLQSGKKTSRPVMLGDAIHIYNDLVYQKKAKGYKEI